MGSLGDGVRTETHLLFIPIPHHGHLHSGLRLVTELAKKGITITCAIYDDVLVNLSSNGLLSELQSLNVQFIGLHNTWGATHDINPVTDARNLEVSFKPVLDKLLHDRSCGIAGPTCLLTDTFLAWAKDVSEKLEIPFYIFIPSGAILAKLIQEFSRLIAQNVVRIGRDSTLSKYEGAVGIDGLPSLRHHEIIYTARRNPAYFVTRSQVLQQAAGIIINTFYELERNVIESMVSPSPLGFEENKVGKVYPVGPLFTPPVNRSIAVVKELKDSASECISWLNAQPPTSVLYVAFGTVAKLDSEKIHELAMGLEGSNQRFLWVLPQRKSSSNDKMSSITDLLPQGFQARVPDDRGRIVTGWAPQLQILAHSATGGFLTHAGWNSCLESAMNGVPMIAWPQSAEQHLNCRYVVDKLQIAEEVHTGAANISDRKEIERAVRALMEGQEGAGMRRRADELKRKGAIAVADGGSMSKAIDDLARDLCAGVPMHADVPLQTVS